MDISAGWTQGAVRATSSYLMGAMNAQIISICRLPRTLRHDGQHCALSASVVQMPFLPQDQSSDLRLTCRVVAQRDVQMFDKGRRIKRESHVGCAG